MPPPTTRSSGLTKVGSFTSSERRPVLPFSKHPPRISRLPAFSASPRLEHHSQTFPRTSCNPSVFAFLPPPTCVCPSAFFHHQAKSSRGIGTSPLGPPRAAYSHSDPVGSLKVMEERVFNSMMKRAQSFHDRFSTGNVSFLKSEGLSRITDFHCRWVNSYLAIQNPFLYSRRAPGHTSNTLGPHHTISSGTPLGNRTVFVCTNGTSVSVRLDTERRASAFRFASAARRTRSASAAAFRCASSLARRVFSASSAFRCASAVRRTFSASSAFRFVSAARRIFSSSSSLRFASSARRTFSAFSAFCLTSVRARLRSRISLQTFSTVL